MRSETSRWGLVAGTLSALFLAVSALVPPGGNELALAAAHQRQLIIGATVVLAWAVFSIPFVVALGQTFRPNQVSLALTATVSSSLGIALLAFGVFMHIGALLSIVAQTTAATAALDAHQAAIWSHLGFYVTDPGLMMWGLGQFVFGWLTWQRQSRRWLGVVGMLGGAAGLLTLTVYQTGVLAVAQFASFTIIAFAADRNAAPVAATAST
jgi:hypothetical protein